MDLRTILFIAEGQLGDLLVLTPALRAMSAAYPSAKISVLVLERRLSVPGPPGRRVVGPLPPDANSALATCPFVHNLFTLDRQGLTSLSGIPRLRAELEIVRFLRSMRFDAVVCTFPEDRFVLWAFAAGAPIRVGQKHQAFSFLLTGRPDVRKDRGGVRKYYCDLVRAAGAELTSDRTEYRIPAQSVGWAEEFLRDKGLDRSRRLIGVHPGATGEYKIWPPESYAELIDALQADPGSRVVFFRGDQDEAITAEIRGRLRSSVAEVNTSGSLGNFAALLSRCALCISNDSGPRHLAAALGVPSLAFFRRNHASEWQIYTEAERSTIILPERSCTLCPPDACLDRVPEGERFGAHCLRSITVRDALAHAQRILGDPGP